MTRSNEQTVRQLDGDQIRAWLTEHGGPESPMRIFRYRANRPGLWFLGIVALLCVVGVFVLVARPGPLLHIQWIAIALLTGLCAWSAMSVVHWGLYSVLRYVALSPTELLVGRGRRATVFPLARLTRETMQVGAMRAGARIALPVQLDGVHERIHLVGAFALLNDLNQFIAEVLAIVATDEELQAWRAAPDEGAVSNGAGNEPDGAGPVPVTP